MLIVVVSTYILIGVLFGLLYEFKFRSLIDDNQHDTSLWMLIFWPWFVAGAIKGWIDTHKQ